MLGQRWTPESSGKQVPAHLVCTGGPFGVATLHWKLSWQLKLVNSEELARAGFAGGVNVWNMGVAGSNFWGNLLTKSVR